MKKRRYFIWEDACDAWCYVGDTVDDVEHRIEIEEQENDEIELEDLRLKVAWMTDDEINSLKEI